MVTRREHAQSLCIFREIHDDPHSLLRTPSCQVKQFGFGTKKDKCFTRYLIKFAIQAKGPDGKWTRKPLAYRESNNVHIYVTHPPEICVNSVFKHIHASEFFALAPILLFGTILLLNLTDLPPYTFIWSIHLFGT